MSELKEKALMEEIFDLKDPRITPDKGERYPCKPDIFVLNYEPV